MAERGLTRFEVVAPAADRELVRSVARVLATGGADAEKLRASLAQPSRGNVYRALTRAPAAVAELDLSRDYVVDRVLEL